MNAMSLLNNVFWNGLTLYYIICSDRNAAGKKKRQLDSAPANKWIAELPERREQIKTQVQFRTEILESKATC